MKHDTTTWILLLVLLFLLLKKKAAADTLTGRRGLTGAAGTPGKPGILQQIFGRQPTPTKGPTISAGGGAGTPGAGGGTASRPAPPSTAPPNQTGWRPPLRRPVNLIPSSPLSSLIPSIPPPTYDLPEVSYPGQLATIPSDTSGLYILPEAPPSYESVSSTVLDWSGLQGQNLLDSITVNIPGADNFDPTYFNPIETYSSEPLSTTTMNGVPVSTGIEYLDYPTYDYPTMNYSGNGFPGYDTGGAWGSGTSEPGTFALSEEGYSEYQMLND